MGATILKNRITESGVVSVSADEVDYLCQKYNIKDSRELFNWGIKMLYDLSKLDDAGWRLTLTKCKIDETTKEVIHDTKYQSIYFLMKWLRPTKQGFARLPLPETLNEKFKK